MMTKQQANDAADQMIVLIEQATKAVKAGQHDVAAQLMVQVHAIALTMPTKEVK